ncbi:hypothetical protein GGI21_006588, partial [Coemansia aciculifera]
SAPSAATITAAKKPAKAEIDFIDFFSSIDDGDDEPASNPNPVSDFGTPNAAYGYSAPIGADGGFGGQHGMANNGVSLNSVGGGMTDFDAMFHALSNPFAAQQVPNHHLQQQQQQVSSASPFADLSSSNVSSMALGIQQQQQQQPFGGFSTSTTIMPDNTFTTSTSTSTMQFASFGNAG